MPSVRAIGFRFCGLAMLAAIAAVSVHGQEPARHFLWKVTAASGAEAYLLGSVHVLTPAFYPLDPAIDRAFQASKVLVEEVDLDEMANPATMIGLVGKAMLPEGQTLDRVVASDTYEAIRARAESHGVPLAILQRMKPWMAAVTLTTAALTRAGFDSALGIDKHFFDRAKAAGMPRRALETVAYQFDRLDGLGAGLQEASLKAMLADIDAQAGNIEALAAAWKGGDATTIAQLLHDSFKDEPELAERLLYERNRNWVPHVERCLTENAGCFVVVGAAHLVGRGSLVDLLRERKHAVVQQ